jgi:hypothetical protein
MPNTEITDRLEHIEERLTNVEGTAYLHSRRHENDASMLARVLDNLEAHLSNHHSRLSTIKQSSGITAALLMLGAFAELLRRFFL